MSLTKAEVRAAFREAAVRSYAHIPPDEEINHIFSERFYCRMDALIEEERRGSWRLLSRRRRRTLLLAAILAVSLLLTACTPKLREAVTEFVVSIYEKFADYGAKAEVHEELETIYILDPALLDLVLISQSQPSAYFIETVYMDNGGNTLFLRQATSPDINGFSDTEQGETSIIGESNISILVFSSKERSSASWIFDGYYMRLSYYGEIGRDVFISLIETLIPTT